MQTFWTIYGVAAALVLLLAAFYYRRHFDFENVVTIIFAAAIPIGNIGAIFWLVAAIVDEEATLRRRRKENHKER